MYITELTLTFAPGKPDESHINIPLTILQDWSGTGAIEIKGFTALFASENDLQRSGGIHGNTRSNHAPGQ